jgi:hypothetical protein
VTPVPGLGTDIAPAEERPQSVDEIRGDPLIALGGRVAIIEE